METSTLWARHGDAVRQALELGELVHRDTASAELPDALVLCAIHSGLLSTWAEAFPAPRHAPASGREGLCAAPLAARCAGLSARRTAGSGRRFAAVVGALGSRVDVWEPAQGFSWRSTSDDRRSSGAGLCKAISGKDLTLLKWACADDPPGM